MASMHASATDTAISQEIHNLINLRAHGLLAANVASTTWVQVAMFLVFTNTMVFAGPFSPLTWSSLQKFPGDPLPMQRRKNFKKIQKKIQVVYILEKRGPKGLLHIILRRRWFLQWCRFNSYKGVCLLPQPRGVSINTTSCLGKLNRLNHRTIHTIQCQCNTRVSNRGALQSECFAMSYKSALRECLAVSYKSLANEAKVFAVGLLTVSKHFFLTKNAKSIFPEQSTSSTH